MKWATDSSDGQYRRSLYIFWKRQNIHPTMLAFDAPTRQECTAKRNITNTPGQALALLNDPIFVEAARVFAERVCGLPDSNTDQRLDFLYSQTLQREPTAKERDVLKQLLREELQHYKNNLDEAERLTSIGKSTPPPADKQSEIAAWTAVTRSVLNTHEFLNRQ